tara:strand:- start:3205 stop:3444 length:240 start_codon:yes stop_codon:yes gene_type:complete
MSKIKSIYDLLKPSVKSELQASARKYSSAKLLKYTLMSKMTWSELTMREVSELLTYSNLQSYKLSAYDFLYGENIINKD